MLIAISQRGETQLIRDNVRNAKARGYEIISFTRRADSSLAALSDLCFLIDPVKQSLVGAIPNTFFGKTILAFEALLAGCVHAPAPQEIPAK